MKPLKGVSPEAQERLELYHALLLKWQARINLISPATVPDAWERHFADSVQVAGLIPAGGKTLYDLGSGGGFPGLVIALVRSDLEVHLVESDTKKCAFLQTVSRETKCPVVIHNARVEAVAAQADAPVPDVVTARALASLDVLLGYCRPWIEARDGLTLVFPKGEAAQSEISVSREKWSFDLTETVSGTGPKARILTLAHVKSAQ